MANEEEYHLPGDAPEASYQTETVPPAEKAKKFDYKKIIILIVVAVAIWGVHHLYTVVKSRATKQQNITNLPPATLQQPTAFTAVTPTSTKPMNANAALPSATPPSPGIDNRLANVEEGNAEAQAKIERTNANLAELQNTIATMSSQIAALNNTVQDLTGQITQQQVQIQSLAAANIQRHRRSGGGPAQVKVREYFIQAVIPGRAWLTTSNGHSITVSVGESVPGYGVVTAVNPNPGVVSTSSGKDIIFKSDES